MKLNPERFDGLEYDWGRMDGNINELTIPQAAWERRMRIIELNDGFKEAMKKLREKFFRKDYFSTLFELEWGKEK